MAVSVKVAATQPEPNLIDIKEMRVDIQTTVAKGLKIHELNWS